MKEQFNVIAVFFTETWPRIMTARRLHKLNRLDYIVSHVRCIPWPHVEAYNKFVTTLATSSTAKELKVLILTTKEHIIRRLNHNSHIFNRFGHFEFDLAQYEKVKLTKAEKIAARQVIAQLLQVGPDGEALAEQVVPGFEEWQPEAWKKDD